MNLSVETLHAAMQRVRSEVLQPYATIRTQTTQMSNLHRTTDMLRHVLQRLKLIAKLKVCPDQRACTCTHVSAGFSKRCLLEVLIPWYFQGFKAPSIRGCIKASTLACLMQKMPLYNLL